VGAFNFSNLSFPPPAPPSGRGVFVQALNKKVQEMEKELIDLKIDKRMFSVVSLSDQSDDKDYWLAKTPADRLRHIEILRRINYGISATSRLQRILEYVEN
jgi:hypothetical protein